MSSIFCFRKFEELGCHLHAQGVTEITENGIMLKNGDELKVDFIVLATGYDMFHYKEVPMVRKLEINIFKDKKSRIENLNSLC